MLALTMRIPTFGFILNFLVKDTDEACGGLGRSLNQLKSMAITAEEQLSEMKVTSDLEEALKMKRQELSKSKEKL